MTDVPGNRDGNHESNGRIDVLQFNCGSLSANLHEIRSRLSQLDPDLVLIQETNLNTEKIIKFGNYTVIRKDRQQPRRNNTPTQGGGLIILIKNSSKTLTFEVLPSTQSTSDTTTETLRVWLYIIHGRKQITIDVANIYIPPLHKNKNMGDERHQNFKALYTFDQILSDYKRMNSDGLLISGDFNAHPW